VDAVVWEVDRDGQCFRVQQTVQPCEQFRATQMVGATGSLLRLDTHWFALCVKSLSHDFISLSWLKEEFAPMRRGQQLLGQPRIIQHRCHLRSIRKSTER
jgi:hypothetical protein